MSEINGSASSARTFYSFFFIPCSCFKNSDVKRPNLRPGLGNHCSLCPSNFSQLPVILVPGKLISVLYLELAYRHFFSVVVARAFKVIPTSPYFCPLTELQLNHRECDGLTA